MSVTRIQQYYRELENTRRLSQSRTEMTLRAPFQRLLGDYCANRDLVLLPEEPIKLEKGIIRPDGIARTTIGVNYGFWESKDEADDLDKEIQAKFDKGYPQDNIIFEDSQTAALIQAGTETMRVPMDDPEALDKLLNAFVTYERTEVKDFKAAIVQFQQDLPIIIEALRKMIEEQYLTNAKFKQKRDEFLELCREAINPEVEPADVREMIIQHILTEEIFKSVFDDTDFHRHNNIAHELQAMLDTFLSGPARRNLLDGVGHYYKVIRATASQIANHHQKQTFLKSVYENFYKVYNPKAADRLGVVYTPNEIVRFMVESTDYLLHKHFGRFLHDKNVEILDPATGTGTFITDIIDYIPAAQLAHKYKHEMHANEVAILPYYIANLNIEYSYYQKMGDYQPFENIVFVDTLDNMGFGYQGKQMDMFGISAENSQRIRRQNQRKISVIIGNPPYNANQANENENNQNRKYPTIDNRIRNTYSKFSTATNKANLIEPYTRFYRWASDRLNTNGILSFITNRSFIDKTAFDGFRKAVADEFQEIYIVDLGGDVRANSKLSGDRNNVFGIQTGVAIAFLVRNESKKDLPCSIYYTRRPELETASDKLAFLQESKLEKLPFEHIIPSQKNNWINLADNDFEELVELANKNTKRGSKKESLNSVFKLYTLGVNTNRDEWVYDLNKVTLTKKMQFFIGVYNGLVSKNDKSYPTTIKWSSSLKNYFKRKVKGKFSSNLIIDGMFRPYVKMFHYSEKIFNHRLTSNHFEIFGKDLAFENLTICFSGVGSTQPFHSLISNRLVSLDYLEKTQCIPLYRYENGERVDNITDWGLQQFVEHYAAAKVGGAAGKTTPKPSQKGNKITKLDIFHYTYAVLHNPHYRAKYALNLKREFPRLPFYDDFWQWAAWGQQLMELHLNYESVAPYGLQVTTIDDARFANPPLEGAGGGKPGQKVANTRQPKVKLKALKESGEIVLDEVSTLSGVPKEAWQYKLGNRSAIEWILDQYKEKKPRSETIAEKFDTYRFADYKTQVIDLLQRVTTVSVETMKIVNQMEATMPVEE